MTVVEEFLTSIGEISQLSGDTRWITDEVTNIFDATESYTKDRPGDVLQFGWQVWYEMQHIHEGENRIAIEVRVSGKWNTSSEVYSKFDVEVSDSGNGSNRKFNLKNTTQDDVDDIIGDVVKAASDGLLDSMNFFVRQEGGYLANRLKDENSDGNVSQVFDLDAEQDIIDYLVSEKFIVKTPDGYTLDESWI